MVPPLPPLLVAAVTAPQLSPENLLQLRAAGVAMRKVRRAVSVASFDGWTIGAFGALTLLTGLTEASSVLLGLGMGVVAFVELRGAARLRRLDVTAARVLGWNQLVLGTLLLAYAVWNIIVVMRGGGELASIGGADPQLGQLMEPVEGLARTVMLAIYATLIVIAFFGQGGMALYYFTRGKHLESYVAQTPPWIVAMQRAGVTI